MCVCVCTTEAATRRGACTRGFTLEMLKALPTFVPIYTIYRVRRTSIHGPGECAVWYTSVCAWLCTMCVPAHCSPCLCLTGAQPRCERQNGGGRAPVRTDGGLLSCAHARQRLRDDFAGARKHAQCSRKPQPDEREHRTFHHLVRRITHTHSRTHIMHTNMSRRPSPENNGPRRAHNNSYLSPSFSRSVPHNFPPPFPHGTKLCRV